MVERTDTPVRPSRGSRTVRKVRTTSPPSSRPSQGFPASRSSSPRVVAVYLVHRSLSRARRRTRGLPPHDQPGGYPGSSSAGLGALSGCHSHCRPETVVSDAPPGVSRPSSDMGNGVRFTRAYLTRHVPTSGFLAPSSVSSPATSRTYRTLPLVGFCVPQPFRALGLWRVSAPTTRRVCRSNLLL